MSAPYRPSNAGEGECFMAAFCDRCKVDAAFRANPEEADGCEILASTLMLDVDEPGYPKDWVYGADGKPTCTAFEPETP